MAISLRFNFSRLTFVVFAAGVLSACVNHQGAPNLPAAVELSAEEKQPFYRVDVGDADEASILVEKLNLEVISGDANTIFFRADERSLETLEALGYAPARGEPNSTYTRIVRVWKDERPAAALTPYDILVVNDEGDYWIVEGAIGAVRALSAAGFRITPVTDGEPRPRGVVIFVDRVEDVQRLNRLGMDIFAVGNLPGQRVDEENAPRFNEFAVAPQRNFENRAATARLIDEFGYPPEKIWVQGALFDYQRQDIEENTDFEIQGDS